MENLAEDGSVQFMGSNGDNPKGDREMIDLGEAEDIFNQLIRGLTNQRELKTREIGLALCAENKKLRVEVKRLKAEINTYRASSYPSGSSPDLSVTDVPYSELEQMVEEFWEKWVRPRYSIYDDSQAFIDEEHRECRADLEAIIKEAKKDA